MFKYHIIQDWYEFGVLMDKHDEDAGDEKQIQA